MKYARLELERRYWLAEPPARLDPSSGYRRLVDRYLSGTRLRLRSVESAAGERLACKLGLKEVRPGDPPTHRHVTNLYLDEGEYDRLSALEAKTLVKRRYPFKHEGERFGIDVFEGPLAGLVLAEIEFDTRGALEAFRGLPTFAACEVSEDPFFTGGSLVETSREALLEKLAHMRRDIG